MQSLLNFEAGELGFEIRDRQAVSDRFWSKVDCSGNCWIWTAAKDSNGYGAFKVGGKKRNAHVISFLLSGRVIHAGEDVCHSCDNRKCVRPSHLFAGSRSVNVRDMFAKGRQPLHNKINPFRKLTNEEASKARELYASGQHTERGLARLFGLHRRALRRLLKGDTYKDSLRIA